MAQQGSGYWPATRHPWMSVLFVAPLLACYELGLLLLNHPHPEQLRNGADAWLRGLVGALGLRMPWLGPVVLASSLLAWGLWRYGDRPKNKLGIWIGMTLESAAFAGVLFAAGQAFWYALHLVGQPLGHSGPFLTLVAVEQMLGFLGAGLYEETLFRLVLYTALAQVFLWAEFSDRASVVLAALGSALVFAVAHHLGPQGEPFHGYHFCFRLFAGVFFAVLFQLRGFGIAVGAHTGYDLLVGIFLQT